ncbi:hypothetical protein NX059_010698 [Plenodomus lindquistii]|nr:hypothetical protein NX059_010698 [Plenodomus lindquistii]
MLALSYITEKPSQVESPRMRSPERCADLSFLNRWDSDSDEAVGRAHGRSSSRTKSRRREQALYRSDPGIFLMVTVTLFIMDVLMFYICWTTLFPWFHGFICSHPFWTMIAFTPHFLFGGKEWNYSSKPSGSSWSPLSSPNSQSLNRADDRFEIESDNDDYDMTSHQHRYRYAKLVPRHRPRTSFAALLDELWSQIKFKASFSVLDYWQYVSNETQAAVLITSTIVCYIGYHILRNYPPYFQTLLGTAIIKGVAEFIHNHPFASCILVGLLLYSYQDSLDIQNLVLLCWENPDVPLTRPEDHAGSPAPRVRRELRVAKTGSTRGRDFSSQANPPDLFPRRVRVGQRSGPGQIATPGPRKAALPRIDMDSLFKGSPIVRSGTRQGPTSLPYPRPRNTLGTPPNRRPNGVYGTPQSSLGFSPDLIKTPPRTTGSRPIPYRIATPFSLWNWSTWFCHDDWSDDPSESIPVRESTWACFVQVQRWFWAARWDNLISLQGRVWDYLKFQAVIFAVLAVIEAYVAQSEGRDMNFNWMVPDTRREFQGMFWPDRGLPGHGPVLDVFSDTFEFWKGWIFGVSKALLWRLPKYSFSGIWKILKLLLVEEREDDNTVGDKATTRPGN